MMNDLLIQWIEVERDVMIVAGEWIDAVYQEKRQYDEALVRQSCLPLSDRWRRNWADARLTSPAWVREIVEQCVDANVPCFVKQLGAVWAR